MIGDRGTVRRIERCILEHGAEENVSRTPWARGIKRAVDLAVGSVCLVVAGPLILVGIVAMKLTSPGPAFFLQARTGRRGEEFKPFKLRTMTAGRTPDPNELVPLDHPGVTGVGRVLRRFKMDELPQILNVLTGEMALLGPRPTLPEQTRAYDAFQRRRLLVRPGLTGLAQVNGNTSISWDERIKYDVYYVKHHGFLMDVGIVLKTMLVVFLGETRFARVFDESPYGRRDARHRAATHHPTSSDRDRS